MELNLHALRAHLLKGDANQAWQSLAPLLADYPAHERRALADQIAEAVKYNVADADPVVMEQFFGRMFLACGQEEKGKQALARAIRWKDARAWAEREFGLDFDDQAALYRFLATNDFREYKEGRSRSHRARLLLDERTVAYHFHAQQMETCLPVLQHFPGAHWLTVGDGRHAFEARFLMRHGAKVLPTNIDPTLLEEAKQLGLINDYRVEDMEKLSFADKSFDFVCCKDSLHHCLSPWQALYEMMRVARQGIFLIEPFDNGFSSSAIYGTRSNPFHWFEEEAGNYAYSFSERELEKLCVSRGWRCIAARGICNLSGHGIDDDSINPDDVRRQRERVTQLEDMATNGKAAYVNLGALLLRELPSLTFRRALCDAGFTVTDLPLNPHTRRAVLQSLDILYNKN